METANLEEKGKLGKQISIFSKPTQKKLLVVPFGPLVISFMQSMMSSGEK